ncbi:unnamed protein product [Notodromas monacha]|uniref:FAS1 domain-containing protein n=1 Tax=Notodromas monacha TaxID=399045 RepID=A0A7R9GG22_9CRUS|nr:unnamed protein product [Notodromas monacha]CAG0919732.1 unnamed protein product [Notodromas monacha]
MFRRNLGENPSFLDAHFVIGGPFLSRIPKTLGQAMLESKSVTALVPTNEAVRRFEERKRQEGHDLNVVWSQIYQYHFLNLPLTASDLQEEVLTELRGNYPVYVTRTEHHDRRQSTIYLNNARLLRHDIRGSVKDDLGMQEPQVMHIIDEVLEPIVPRIRNNKAPEASLFNPSAWELLDKSSEYNLALTKWRGIVMERNMQDWYSGSELKTYFIPIDAGNRIEKGRLDDLALAGHVIPGQVLFTRTLNSGSTHGQAVKFESGVAELVASDKYQGRARNQAPKLKVMLSVKNITSPDANRKMHTLLFAQSHTVVGDQLRKEGTVMVEIERANIPVKNGVVHLIKRPLLTVDETLTQLIEGNPDLKKFAELLKTQAPTTWNAILRANEGTTVLAPSDEAFNRMGRQTYTNLVSNRKRFEQIASYHVVLEKFSIKNALNIKKSATQDDEIIDENEERLSIEVS